MGESAMPPRRKTVFAVEELGVDVNGGVPDGDSGVTPLCKARRAEFAREAYSDWARSRVAPETEAGRCLSAPRSTAYLKIRS